MGRGEIDENHSQWTDRVREKVLCMVAYNSFLLLPILVIEGDDLNRQESRHVIRAHIIIVVQNLVCLQPYGRIKTVVEFTVI